MRWDYVLRNKIESGLKSEEADFGTCWQLLAPFVVLLRFMAEHKYGYVQRSLYVFFYFKAL